MANGSFDDHAGPAPQVPGELSTVLLLAFFVEAQSGPFVPITAMRSTQILPLGRPPLKAFVSPPLLHVHAPHVASATQPVIPRALGRGGPRQHVWIELCGPQPF